jgi:hypothetical protein
MSLLSAFVAAVFWLGFVRLLLRWPGRVLGIGGALLAWTMVGPWALWAVLAILVGASIGRRRARYSARLPLVRAALAASAVAFFARGR